MEMLIPKINKTVCITDDPIIAAEISSLENQRNYYFPVLEGPRMQRPDAINEIVKRCNSIARIRPNQVIISALDDDGNNELKKRIHENILLEIDSTHEINDKLIFSSKKIKNEFLWGPQRLSIGLLKAKELRKRLHINLKESPQDIYVPGNEHLIVFEERDDIASVIVANYAYSIGASFITIPPIPDDESENILESFYTIYSEDSGLSITEKIDKLRKRIRDLAPNIDFKGVKFVTFFTNHLPWGFAFPEIPSTHIYSYPELGTFLVNSIVTEQQDETCQRVALIVDPVDNISEEFNEVIDFFRSKKSYIRFLFSRAASVHNVSLHLAAFPYDFLLISTHAGDVSGRRLHYQITDIEGNTRELVIELGAGFAVQPESDLISVTRHIRPVSLDGVPWRDHENIKSLYKGSVITDYIEMSKTESPKLKLLKAEDIQRVRGAMALKMYDHNYFPYAHRFADRCFPIIFNNACNSWREMSMLFLFGGARAYIGSMFEITEIEANELMINIFKKHGTRPLIFALWRAQNDTYNTMRHPYVMFGPHFTGIRTSKINTTEYLISTMNQSIKDWHEYSSKATKKDLKENSKKYAEFLEKELHAFLEKVRKESDEELKS